MLVTNFWDRALKYLASDVRVPEPYVRNLVRVVAAAGLLLLAVTWRLWTPQTVFPQVPFIHRAGSLPAFFQWIGLGLMFAGLLCALLSAGKNPKSRAGLILFSAATVGMVMADQHRLQPWAYQLSIAAVVLAFVPGKHALALLRMLTVSLYFHSAVSKLDFSFLETNGQDLVSGLLGTVGLSLEYCSPATRRMAAAMLPVGELLVAFALCSGTLRRLGFYGSIAMHALLLIALGPLGMNHMPGVLIWNGYFILQNWLLFGRHLHSGREVDVLAPRPAAACAKLSSCSRWTEALVVAVVLLPLLESLDRIDHWPAWAVYAAHPERVRIYVHNDHVARLPDSLRKHVESPKPFDPWRRVRADSWSLDVLQVPIYPQGRFRLGVAIGIARACDADMEIRIVMDSRANRWTGERTSRVLNGTRELLGETSRFWLNVQPVWNLHNRSAR